MTTIKIEDLNVTSSMTDLNSSKITDVKGGCPVCIPLLLVAAGYAYESWKRN